MAISELKPSQLKRTINLRNLPFETTDSLDLLDNVIGQDRAIRAIQLALEMNHSGYNVFVTGMSGTGRTTIVKNILKNSFLINVIFFTGGFCRVTECFQKFRTTCYAKGFGQTLQLLPLL